jgi:hypothetical protein
MEKQRLLRFPVAGDSRREKAIDYGAGVYCGEWMQEE